MFAEHNRLKKMERISAPGNKQVFEMSGICELFILTLKTVTLFLHVKAKHRDKP